MVFFANLLVFSAANNANKAAYSDLGNFKNGEASKHRDFGEVPSQQVMESFAFTFMR